MNEIQGLESFGIGDNFEMAVSKLERDLRAIADGRDIVCGSEDKPVVNDLEELPIDHFFMEGVYVRRMIMYRGQLVIGHIHKHKHMCFLLKGHVSVASRIGVVEHKAPCYFISDPGEKRVVYAHEESHWYNTHKNPTNTEDVDELERATVAFSYEEYNKYKKEQDEKRRG